jgi:hypothetical protein
MKRRELDEARGSTKTEERDAERDAERFTEPIGKTEEIALEGGARNCTLKVLPPTTAVAIIKLRRRLLRALLPQPVKRAPIR